jgi:hypothetical protein
MLRTKQHQSDNLVLPSTLKSRKWKIATVLLCQSPKCERMNFVWSHRHEEILLRFGGFNVFIYQDSLINCMVNKYHFDLGENTRLISSNIGAIILMLINWEYF